MAQTAEEFFGSLAKEPAAQKPVAKKSAEDFFGDIASGKDKTPVSAPAAAEPAQGATLGEASLGGAEMLMRRATGAVAAIPAGVAYGGAAIGRALGLDVDPRETMSQVQEYLTYDPMSEAGQGGEQALQEGLSTVFKPVASALDTAATRVGQVSPVAETMLRESPFAAGAAGSFMALSPFASTVRSAVRGGVPNAPEMPPAAPFASPDAPVLSPEPLPVASRAPETLEMPQGPPRAPPEPPPAPPLREGGTVEMPVAEKPPVAPLKTEGSTRKTPYTELEGDEPPKFVEDTPTMEGGKQLPEPDQVKRAQILSDIGLEEPRKSAVTGDLKNAATDFQTSKLDTEGGNYLSRVFETERAALEDYSGRILADTGGTPGMGQTEILQRGQNIVTPLDDLKRYFDDGISSLYKAADERAQGVPIQTPKTGALLKDDSEFLGTVEGESLLKGVRARMRSLQMIDPDGAMMPVNVQTAERFKQYLNNQWTPRTSRLIRQLKDSIDDDVTAAAGEDIYAAARGLRASRARILDDPKGIARIMDAEGPEGINRAVAIEKIPDTITTMPVAQFKHIVQTLRNVPEDIAPAAAGALSEIKSQFANKIHEVGSRQATQWNAKGVSQYLNTNSARMNALFTPEEMKQFATLNDAGHILRFPSSYPGAAVQAHNIAKTGVARGIEGALTSGGAAAGAIFGDFTGAAGGFLGHKAATTITEKMAARKSLAEAKKRTQKLSELLKVGKEP
jgi:hypothetical protein